MVITWPLMVIDGSEMAIKWRALDPTTGFFQVANECIVGCVQGSLGSRMVPQKVPRVPGKDNNNNNNKQQLIFID